MWTSAAAPGDKQNKEIHDDSFDGSLEDGE
jgi:hypothetical protein